MSEELTSEEQRKINEMVKNIQGDTEPKGEYKMPPVPETVESEAEFLAKSVSDSEFGKFVAHKMLDPTFTKKEEERDD
jgi:cytochrome c551/c552